MWKRKAKQPETQLSLLRSIRSTLIVSMYFLAIIAGSTCDVGETIDFAERLIGEQDEAEADRTMDGGTRI